MVTGTNKVQATEAGAVLPATGSQITLEVLHAIHDMHGREILIGTTDNKRYSGILDAVRLEANSTFDSVAFGLRCVVEVTEENEKNLMRTESEVVDKMTFNYCDIVDFAFVSKPDKHQKMSSKFVTDRQYHGDLPNENEALEEWCGDDEEIGGAIEDQEPMNLPPITSGRRNNTHNNGAFWPVDEMFAANKKMNVVSTFREDLTQYSTVEVVGTDEDRERAERLAREIESNQSSKFYANLENDDVERDLDKTTREDDFEYGNRRKGNQNYNQQQQQRRNPNLAPNGQPVNRRAEGLKSDRRNSGSSSANNSRYNPQQQQQSSQQNYQPQQLQKGGAYNNQNRRQNDSQDYRENDWQMAKGKGQNQGGGHDQSFRQQKQMLDPRPSAKQTANNQEPASEKGSSSRVADLKTWGGNFSISTSPKEQSPAPPAPQGAWNRGPPSSLVSKGSSTESTPPPSQSENDPSAPPAVAPVAAAAAGATSSSSKPVGNQKREESPSTSEGDGQDETDGGRKPVDDEDANDLSDETSSVVTTASKSASFKFNINAPEFKPRIAPTTPTPTTPTGPMGPGGEMPPPHQMQQQPQFIPAGYQHPGMMPQGGPVGVPMGMMQQGGMVPHMGPGGMQPTQQQLQQMWQMQQQGQQGYPPNAQFIQQLPMGPGVPGHMYGPAAANPATAQQSQQAQQQQQQQQAANQQVPTSTAGGAQTDGRQPNQQQQQPPRRGEGEFREPQQPCFYPVTNSGPVMPSAMNQQYFQAQYQAGMPQAQYPIKMVQPQQVPQAMYQQRFGQQLFMVPQGQRFQQVQPQPQQHQVPHQYGGPDQQHQQQGAPQSHPNSQPTTPGPRADQNGQKGQGPPQNGMHREPEGGSNASLSGSTSSQSGQRSGTPPQQQQGQPPQQPGQPQQHQMMQGPPQGPQQGPHGPQTQMIGVPGHMNPHIMMVHPHQHTYYPQQPMYLTMIPQMHPMQQNQHGQQQSVMGERADQGFPQSNTFDYRTLNQNQYQQPQQQYQMHQGHMPRQNSGPQQFQGNANQGMNPSSQQAPPPGAPQGGPPQREQQQQQQQPQSAQN